MFTGLIETMGTVRQARTGNKSIVLGVAPDLPDFSVSPGDSVSVSGVCLTLEHSEGHTLYFTAVHETLSRSTLVQARVGDRVNLERSLTMASRLGGHFVLGHVDDTGAIESDQRLGDSLLRTVAVPPSLARFMAEKGSVAIDGISLTIAASRGDRITVSLVPYSLEKTTMSLKKPGDIVNVECDILARYSAHAAARARAPETDGAAGPASDSLYQALERLDS